MPNKLIANINYSKMWYLKNIMKFESTYYEEIILQWIKISRN